MIRQPICALLGAAAILGAALGQAAAAPPAPVSALPAPSDAPVIVIKIGVRRFALVPRPTGSSTTISAASIENKANSTSLSSVVASSVPGVAAAPSGEIHIRGSHGQYSYYLDGAPLPTNVSGSFTDLINPKDIETPADLHGRLSCAVRRAVGGDL